MLFIKKKIFDLKITFFFILKICNIQLNPNSINQMKSEQLSLSSVQWTLSTNIEIDNIHLHSNRTFICVVNGQNFGLCKSMFNIYGNVYISTYVHCTMYIQLFEPTV